MRHRERRPTDALFRAGAATVPQRQPTADAPSTPPERNQPEIGEPRADPRDSPARAAVPEEIAVGKLQPTTKSGQLRGAYSFISGSLIGISVSLPVFALDADEGGGLVVLLGALGLAAIGIGMHVHGAKQVTASGIDRRDTRCG